MLFTALVNYTFGTHFDSGMLYFISSVQLGAYSGMSSNSLREHIYSPSEAMNTDEMTFISHHSHSSGNCITNKSDRVIFEKRAIRRQPVHLPRSRNNTR
jgi:hypothetical protein